MKAAEASSETLLWKFDEDELFGCLELNDPVFAEMESPTACTMPSRKPVPRHKRASHIKAEMKRRGKIKNGFHDLETLVPSIECKADSTSTKLNKAAEYCRKLQNDKKTLQQKVILLKNEIELVSQEICDFQMQLPPSGVIGESIPARTSPCASFGKMYDDYVKKQTKDNWKFWIFSEIMRPMFESFVKTVDTQKPVDLVEQGSQWADQHCNLTTLRKDAFMAMRKISKSTSIMTNPELLPQEALQAACGTVQTSPDLLSHTTQRVLPRCEPLLVPDVLPTEVSDVSSPTTPFEDLIDDKDFLSFALDSLS